MKEEESIEMTVDMVMCLSMPTNWTLMSLLLFPGARALVCAACAREADLELWFNLVRKVLCLHDMEGVWEW